MKQEKSKKCIYVNHYVPPSKQRGFQLIKKYVGLHKCSRCGQHSKRGRRSCPIKQEKALGLKTEFVCDRCILKNQKFYK